MNFQRPVRKMWLSRRRDAEPAAEWWRTVRGGLLTPPCGERAPASLVFQCRDIRSGRRVMWSGYPRTSGRRQTPPCAFALPYVCAGSTFLGAMGLTVTRWPPNARPFRPWRANRIVAVGYIVIHLHGVTAKNAVRIEKTAKELKAAKQRPSTPHSSSLWGLL